MVILEGYYDESGGFDDPSGLFVVSGYLITASAAREMERLWRNVLAEHNIPYFHMVDCAHEPPSGVFVGKDKTERALIVRKLIDLIKTYTIEGISLIARASSYQGPRWGEPDVYSQMASTCAQSAYLYMGFHGMRGGVAYFFEDGHNSKNNAYRHIAQNVKREDDSVEFAGKTAVPLLQAADLLAWQTAKYAKDYFYPSKIDGGKPLRSPRKDFQSLMQHTHMFFHFDTGENNQAAGIETWPMSGRGPVDLHFTIED